ncbi:hypothetical protein SAY87_019938 [Trapa incisa]|uniref:Photolyase/cryptochrome alpha/beta domain-containing protein n=2 Tax=Trapa TaxID=22665 RepID=A0AAN7K354_9MYRT|nr:hypothetical protein SAY87_019938 [Trapa incisa]
MSELEDKKIPKSDPSVRTRTSTPPRPPASASAPASCSASIFASMTMSALKPPITSPCLSSPSSLLLRPTRSVNDLSNSLRSGGSDLVVRVGHPEEVLPEMAKAIGAHAVYVHREVSKDAVKTKERIEAAMNDNFWGSTLFHMDDLPLKLEDMPVNYEDFQESGAWRRGISAAAAAATQGVVGTGSAVMPKKAGERKVGSAHKVTWGPDPKRGYYRPDDRTEEIDVAELRAAFLNRESNKRG